MKKIVVTGSSGKAGRTVVRHLLEHGYQVLGVDQTLAANLELAEFKDHWSAIRANLTDFSETLEVLQGADAVVHLANIPAPGLFAPARTFLENNAMNYNVFSAAQMLKLERVVWASSETTLGFRLKPHRVTRPSMKTIFRFQNRVMPFPKWSARSWRQNARGGLGFHLSA